MPKLPRRLEQLELYRQPERIPDWKTLPETVREEVLRNLTGSFGIDGSEWLRIRKREGRGMSDKIKAHHLNRNAGRRGGWGGGKGKERPIGEG